MKKLCLVLLSSLLVFSLGACGRKDERKSDASETTHSSQKKNASKKASSAKKTLFDKLVEEQQAETKKFKAAGIASAEVKRGEGIPLYLSLP